MDFLIRFFVSGLFSILAITVRQMQNWVNSKYSKIIFQKWNFVKTFLLGICDIFVYLQGLPAIINECTNVQLLRIK